MDDGTPVGFVALLTEEPLEGVAIFGKKAGLLEIGVAEEFRGGGYGKELLDYAEEQSIIGGAYCLYAATYARDHDTIRFYGRNGFIPVATLPDVNGPGDDGDVYMRKIINTRS